MGLTDSLHGKRVYFDTNIFIYIIEGNSKYQHLIDELAGALPHGRFEAVTSHITLAEVLPPLVRRGDKTILAGTIEFLRESGLFTLIPAGEDICLQVGVLRGELGMKTPDAIHVASAIHHHCEIFLTNDKGIRTPDGIERILISEMQNDE